jgi:sugar diacid utilization regulator
MEIEKLYYTKKEACEKLGIHRNTLYAKKELCRFKKLTMKQILQIKKTIEL